ncbi:MAG: AMP-binding protein [Clostridiales Family XIII bacterium]|jgi:acetyl-CoA synthetase|nr:AMP-binding protein [Clostridiales Family XIII bacterium]
MADNSRYRSNKPWFDLKEFKDYDDFVANYKIDRPENFNFAFDCMDELAKEDPDKTAMVWVNDTGDKHIYTFGELKLLSDAAARYFQSIGIGQQDRVMLILRRRAEYWICILALMKIGAVAIPATHHLTMHDIEFRNNAAGVAAIVTTDDEYLLEHIKDSKKNSPSLRHIIRIGKDDIADKEKLVGFDNLTEGIAAHMLDADSASVDSNSSQTEISAFERVTKNEDMMLLYFTSGTTGMPKMVAHNYLYPLGHITTAKYWHNLHPGSLHLTLSDTGWAKAAWGKIYGQWLCKAAIMVYEHDQMKPSRLLKVMADNKVTSFCAPPTVYRVLINTDFKKYDLSALEYATSAGEPLNEDVFNKFKDLTGLEIYEAYGQTESTPMVLTSKYSKPVPGSIGLINPFYDLRFLDDDCNEVEVGQEGEMCINCKPGDMGVFMGYFENDEMTAEAWRGGFYHTGDLAVQDETGHIWFVGRSDDIIKSAGYRIGPFEVESVVQEHDSVLECAVTGVPDPLRGQNIKVSIILNEGWEPNDQLKKEIKRYVKANAAAYKIPRVIEFVDELPKTISGKVRRTEIRKSTV